MLRYLETFFRNRWLVSFPALLLVFSGSALVVLVKPEHTATATVWTEQLPFVDLPTSATNRYLTPAQIQRNRLDELRHSYTFARAIVDRTPVGMGGIEQDKLELVGSIQDNLSIRNLGDNLIRIEFPHVDASLALSVIQTTIEEYTRVTGELATFQLTETRAYYQERIKEYETQVVPATSKAVTDYLTNHPELRDARNAQTDPNFALLQQQADSARNELEQYQRSLDTVRAQSDAVSRNQTVAFRIMDAPSVTTEAALSKKTLVLYAGVGVALGAGYALLFLFLATELDQTMRNSRDVRQRLGLNVLEVIPDYADGHLAEPPASNIKRPTSASPVRSTTMG